MIVDKVSKPDDDIFCAKKSGQFLLQFLERLQ